MKRYESYKDSGIEWIKKIPSHWNVKRTKSFLVDTNEISLTGKEELLTVSHITGVTRRSEKNVNMFLAETNVGYKKCYPGDIVINTMWAWMGALGTCKDEGICSPAYNVYHPLRNAEYYDKYFDYLFRTPNFIVEMTRFSKGIVSSRLRLYPREFYQIFSAIPPLKEQIAIANYLATRTQFIDKKTELLHKKIKSYKEFRKAFINKIICRGLDKNVKLKDSKIDWIGEIPEHWEVKRVKDVFEIGRGRVIAQTELIKDGNYPVYSSQTENDGCLGFINTYDFNAKLLTWTTDGANAGTVFLRKGKFNCTNVCGTLKPKYGNLNYLFFSLQESTRHNKRIDTNGAKIMNNEMSIIHFVYPPIEEQNSLVEFVEEKTKKIDSIISNIQQQILKLQELRKSLITDVVTGKIKITE